MPAVSFPGESGTLTSGMTTFTGSGAVVCAVAEVVVTAVVVVTSGCGSDSVKAASTDSNVTGAGSRVGSAESASDSYVVGADSRESAEGTSTDTLSTVDSTGE